MAQVETVKIDPLILLQSLKHGAETLVIYQADCLAIVNCWLIEFQRDRRTRCTRSKPHVGYPLSPLNRYEFDLMPPACGCTGDVNSTKESTNVEAESLQSHQEQAVQFEAIAAPSIVHQLAKQGFKLQVDTSTQLDIEILERNGMELDMMESFQRINRRRYRSSVIEALKVGITIKL